MTIIDIRDIFSPKNVDLLEVTDNYLYYTEEKSEQGHNNLFFLKYDRKSKEETVLANYSLADPTFVQHIYTFEKSIILLLENGGPDVWLVKLQKSTGKEIQTSKLETYGPLESCYALSERYIVIYTKRGGSVKSDDRSRNGYIEPKFMHLYDIEEKTSFRVLDERLCCLNENSILTYSDSNNEKQALILSPFGDEFFKEQCYKKSRFISDQMFDKIWSCPFDTLIADIKRGTNKVKLLPLASADNDGLVRFTGMDNNNIYYRTKNFRNSEECIYACNKNTLENQLIVNIVYDAPKTYYHINKDDAKIYKVSECEGICNVDGVVDTCVHVSYNYILGEFVGCIDERFIVTKKTITDKDGNFKFQYTYIIDTKNKTHEGFECKSVLKGNTVVLY